jgi:hypothetical protein
MKSSSFFLIAIFSLLISGCSTTVPVTAKFPDSPDILQEKCASLKTIDGEKVSIVDLTKTVSINYQTYHECAIKVDSWIEWYNSQKKIFDSIK